MIIWIMGLAGSGKSTLARALAKHLNEDKVRSAIYIDGDDFRDIFGIYGYDRASRLKVSAEKMRLCVALSKQGYIVICSAIALFDECYKFNRELTIKNSIKYLEVYLKCELDELFRRDQKGLYSGAKNGDICEVVGMDIKIDEPNPDIVLNSTDFKALESNIQKILDYIKDNNETR